MSNGGYNNAYGRMGNMAGNQSHGQYMENREIIGSGGGLPEDPEIN